MSVTRPRVSYADLERAPEDGRRHEIYDGEVFVVPSPLPRHQMICKAVLEILDGYAKAHGGLALYAPLDILLTDFDVVQPDVVFFQASRRHHVQLDRPIRHPPDIASEILSPSTETTDRGKKMQLLARHHVPEYWIVDPTATQIEVYTLTEAGYSLIQVTGAGGTVQSVLLRDLVFAASQLFPT